MSSAISTDGASAGKGSAFRPWHFFSMGALLAATAAVLMSPRSLPEHLVMLSLTIFAAGAAAFACYRMVAPLLGRERLTTGESLGAPARRALEREKLLVLRTIKELEFDRAMGKIADDDFAEMAGRLRERAMRLMRQLDDVQTVSRARVERELAARLGAPSHEERAPAARRCSGCDTVNDADARFCKRCGVALAL
jgi:hypothetical protein